MPRLDYPYLLFACGFLLLTASQAIAQTTAFVDVHVVPMNEEVVLPNQTVLVEGEQIVAVGPVAEVIVPDIANVIDGAGRFLMPGLSDLHVHVRHEVELPVYLYHGVTTLLDMGGPSILLDWKTRLADGDLVGPHLLVSYFIDGPQAQYNATSDVAAAREKVRNAHAQQYDYIKVYNSLTTQQFEGIMEEADSLDMAVIGHGVREPGMKTILEGGQAMIAHGEEYIYTYFENTLNEALIPGAVELTKRTGAYVLPNLSTFEIITRQWGKPEVVTEFLKRPEVKYLHPARRDGWQGGRYTSRRGDLTGHLALLRSLTKAFSEAGVPLLLGTDSPGIPGMFPGATIYDDLHSLVESGLSPYQALAAGTRTAGEFVRATRPGAPRFGTIEPGMRADVLLLEENPLDDVAAVKNIAGVMVAGSWRTTNQVGQLLDRLYQE